MNSLLVVAPEDRVQREASIFQSLSSQQFTNAAHQLNEFLDLHYQLDQLATLLDHGMNLVLDHPNWNVRQHWSSLIARLLK